MRIGYFQSGEKTASRELVRQVSQLYSQEILPRYNGS
jgi:hypothetical protein